MAGSVGCWGGGLGWGWRPLQASWGCRTTPTALPAARDLLAAPPPISSPLPPPPYAAGCPQMLEDVNTGIAWVARHMERYGGDPDALYLAGQSAGGQLALLALLNQVCV